MKLNLDQITNIAAGILILAWTGLNKMIGKEPDMVIAYLGSITMSIGMIGLIRSNWQMSPSKSLTFVQESFFWAESPVTRNSTARFRGVSFLWVVTAVTGFFAYVIGDSVSIVMGIIYGIFSILYTIYWFDNNIAIKN